MGFLLNSGYIIIGCEKEIVERDLVESTIKIEV